MNETEEVGKDEQEEPPSPKVEDHYWQYCVNCGTKLVGRKCKLVCLNCGFYHSCSEP